MLLLLASLVTVQARQIRAGDVTGVRGKTVLVPIVLSAEGNEIALGLSLCFDTNLLSFDSVRRGADATGASLLINTNSTSRGRLGLTLSLPGGDAFSAGEKAILEVSFRSAAGGGVVPTAVSICDTPIGREILDGDANSLVCAYANAAITLVGSCDYRISTNTSAFSSGGGAGGVLVSADPGCTWSSVSLAGWITLNAGATGSGNGSVGFDVAVNPVYTGRTGTVLIAGQAYTVTQAPVPCSFRLNLTERVHGPAAEFNFVEVTSSSDCRWTVANTNSWITITGAAGSGSGRIDYWVSANTGGAGRTGSVVIADIPFTVRQLGYPCSYSLTPESRIHSAAAEAAILNVTAPGGCAWYVVNTNDWLIIKLYTNGVGNDIVRYTVFANPQPVQRSGVLTIGGQPFTVYQVGAPCVYGLLEPSRIYGPGPTHDIVSVATLSGCSWTATTTNNWIVINTPSGTGGGYVNFYVSPNWGAQDRTGYIQIGNRVFVVTQIGTPCRYSISPTSRSINSGASTGQISVSTSLASSVASSNQTCHWTALNTNSWVTVYLAADPTNKGTMSYSVAANDVSTSRSGVLVVGGQSFTISQAGIPCTYSVSPTSRSHGYEAESGVFNLTGVTGCAWTPTASDPWIAIVSPSSGNSSGPVSYSVLPNSGAARTGRITLGTATFTVNQGAAAPVAYISQPANRQVAMGSDVSFTVSVTGTPPFTYQWRFNGIGLQESPEVSGVYTPTVTLRNVQPWNSGNYNVIVNNRRGPLTSANAVLTVNSPPRLDPVPGRFTVQGTPVTFIATATDQQAPPQTLTYSLMPGAPSGSSIHPTSGVFLWTPAANQPAGGYPISVRVTDNGVPPMSDAVTTTISVFPGYTTNITLVATGSVWKYRDTGENLGAAWTDPAFDDTLWAQGPAKLGYGDPSVATLVGFGPNALTKYVTTYFRTHFRSSESGKFSALNLRILRDDGAVVYLNGVEVLRDNMPAGPINYLTLAPTKIGAANETIYVVSPPLDPSGVLVADNVVAVEIHQNTVDSSDIGFDLELKGTLNVQIFPAGFAPAASTPVVSVPLVRIAREPAGGVTLSWNTAPARWYRVEYTTNLNGSAWIELGGDLAATAHKTEFIDMAPNSAQRFYRIRLMP